MNRATFYTALKRSGIPGFTSLSQKQVDGIEGILNAFAIVGDGRIKTLAYGLATARREVGSGMSAVREGFKSTDAAARYYVRNRPYGKVINGHVYYGRGIVQLTWYQNYLKEGIAHSPDKALEPIFAARLLFQGIMDGRWNASGKGIAHYLPDEGPDDLYNARRTVNVTDHWEEIKDYYHRFIQVIVEAGGV